MNFVSVRDLRTNTSKIWKDLKVKKEMVITSNGKPIAVLSATDGDNLESSLKMIRQSRASLALESMQEQSVKSGLHKLTTNEINAEIAAVRKKRKK